MSHILSFNALKHFDWEIYLLNNPDLTDLHTQQDARHHYAQVGHLENRHDQVSSLFDWERYSNAYKHLWLNTAREAYIHFMRLGLKYKHEETVQPLHVLILSQYKKIIENNRSAIRTLEGDRKPFVLPPRPKNQTSTPEHRLPLVPTVLNPPKQPVKKLRSHDTIEGRLQPKVMAINPPIKQQIKTTVSSIIKPAPTQKPAAPPSPLPAHMWPPRHVEEKRPPHAPPIFQPLKKPTRSGIIRTNAIVSPPPRRPPQQPVVPPPLELPEVRRSSQAPAPFQPLKQPTRSSIIHTISNSETFSPSPRRPPQQPIVPPPLELPEVRRSSQAPSPFQPLKQPTRSSIIHTNSNSETVAVPPPWPPTISSKKTVEKNRTSQAPSPFQPLKQPSRSTIIRTKTAEETIRHNWHPKPASGRYVQEKPFHQPYKHPLRTLQKQKEKTVFQPDPLVVNEKKPPAFAMYPFQPIRKPRLATKSVLATRYSQKRTDSRITPFWYTQKCAVRKPKEGQLVLTEPPSKYFTRIGVVIGPPKYLN